MAKVPISVISVTVAEGSNLSKLPVSRKLAAQYRVIPLRLLTLGGCRILIDRIDDIRREASTKAGGVGDKYVCRATFGDIQRELNVFRDENEWFLEETF